MASQVEAEFTPASGAAGRPWAGQLPLPVDQYPMPGLPAGSLRPSAPPSLPVTKEIHHKMFSSASGGAEPMLSADRFSGHVLSIARLLQGLCGTI